MSNTTHTSDTNDTTIDDLHLPDPISGADRLRLLYRHPGPYVSLYLATRPLLPEHESDTQERWRMLRTSLETQGATSNVLDAIEARLSLPAPDDAAAIAVLAADDATTIVDYGQEPPHTDVAIVDVLPYAAPLLEWDQRRVPHLVITIDDDGADVATFGPDRFTRLDSLDGTPADIVDPVAKLAEATHAGLILVAGKPFAARRLASDLVSTVPVDCRIVAEPEISGVDDLADAAVRLVSDTAARGTVGYLKELRFLAAHHAAVDGTADTIKALRELKADVLLIHDDLEDKRRVWIGPEPHLLSLESRPDHREHARLIDAAIRAAITSGATVRIIPTTGPDGPDGNTAVISRTAPRALA